MMLACPQGMVGLGLMSAAFSPVDDAKVRAFGLLPQYPICGILVPSAISPFGHQMWDKTGSRLRNRVPQAAVCRQNAYRLRGLMYRSALAVGTEHDVVTYHLAGIGLLLSSLAYAGLRDIR